VNIRERRGGPPARAGKETGRSRKGRRKNSAFVKRGDHQFLNGRRYETMVGQTTHKGQKKGPLEGKKHKGILLLQSNRLKGTLSEPERDLRKEATRGKGKKAVIFNKKTGISG